jgi:hypothetical protein
MLLYYILYFYIFIALRVAKYFTHHMSMGEMLSLDDNKTKFK